MDFPFVAQLISLMFLVPDALKAARGTTKSHFVAALVSGARQAVKECSLHPDVLIGVEHAANTIADLHPQIVPAEKCAVPTQELVAVAAAEVLRVAPAAPLKKDPVTIEIDPDVLADLQSKGLI